MYVPRHFGMSPEEARLVLADVRLADLITVDPETLSPVLTPVPFLYDPCVGEYGAFLGHLARPNPQWSHTANPALVVLRGGDAYVTPDWYPSFHAGKTTVPTWNYEVVQATGTLVTHAEPGWLEAHVRALAAHHDPDYDLDAVDRTAIDGMLRAIVGVEILITAVQGKSKLSQNKSTEDIHGVALGLSGIGRDDLAERMRSISVPYAQARETAVDAARRATRD
ncbi:MAG: FMN-binding negative transcriptional regulator [Propionibacteriaceae bacterium]